MTHFQQSAHPDITITEFVHLEKAGLYLIYCDIDEHRIITNPTFASKYDKPYLDYFFNAKATIKSGEEVYPVEIKNPVLVKPGPSEIEMNKIILSVLKPSFDLAKINEFKNGKIVLDSYQKEA